MDNPICEVCGEGEVTVQTLHVGLCDDCAARQIAFALRDLFGPICGNISRRSNGFLTTCLAPYGVEHEHD